MFPMLHVRSMGGLCLFMYLCDNFFEKGQCHLLVGGVYATCMGCPDVCRH